MGEKANRRNKAIRWQSLRCPDKEKQWRSRERTNCSWTWMRKRVSRNQMKVRKRKGRRTWTKKIDENCLGWSG